VYKISSISDDFSLRYGDITILKMSAVRHLVIVLPPYETTHEVPVAGRSCLSNFMSIWYTDSEDKAIWIFYYVALNAYSGPSAQNGGFGKLWTPKCDYSSSRPPKGTSLRKSASFKLSTVKIRRGVWPGELTELFRYAQTSSFQSVTKNTDRQKHNTFSSTAGARPTIPTLLGMVIEEVRTIFAPPNFFWCDQ